MGKIHDVQKLTDNRFVNLYHVDATSVHNTPVCGFQGEGHPVPQAQDRTQ